MDCIECGASGYGLHHSASCKYLNVDIYKQCAQLQAQTSLKDAEIAKLKELLRYPYEMPMHEAGNYDENCKWKDEVEQVLKDK